ncbi:MAG: NAD-dependent malic enzyme [Legionellales bacterium]|nr:NAD-dependent malic enzyme [Legionellales bacterium]
MPHDQTSEFYSEYRRSLNAQYNKSTGFTEHERELFKLQGGLPESQQTLDQQAEQAYAQYQKHTSDLTKHFMLSNLMLNHQTLYFYLLQKHLEEMLPIVYTPTVGSAVLDYPNHLIMPGGLYLSPTYHGKIEHCLQNLNNTEIDIIVLTDGEAILGLGDQGVSGMKICMAKCAVYSLCGGIDPQKTLPIMLDVGTDNERLLNHPLYPGIKSPRLRGKAYFNFIDHVIKKLHQQFPNALYHWEDFGRAHAERHLKKHSKNLCSFNDDIQGTGAVALATILAACQANSTELKKQTFLIFGAGTAGIGIAECIEQALKKNGLSERNSRLRIWLIDQKGLITDQMKGLTQGQKRYAKPHSKIMRWNINTDESIGLHAVIKNAKPTVLIGCSALRSAFDEQAIQLMMKYTDHPIILPLSNPTERAEANPSDLIKWTSGQARIATGSPFPPVDYQGQAFLISQCNNAMIYPGIGLGRSVSRATHITDNMIWAASTALSQCYRDNHQPGHALLPTWNHIHLASLNIAEAVAQQAYLDGVSELNITRDDIQTFMWVPKY